MKRVQVSVITHNHVHGTGSVKEVEERRSGLLNLSASVTIAWDSSQKHITKITHTEARVRRRSKAREHTTEGRLSGVNATTKLAITSAKAAFWVLTKVRRHSKAGEHVQRSSKTGDHKAKASLRCSHGTSGATPTQLCRRDGDRISSKHVASRHRAESRCPTPPA